MSEVIRKFQQAGLVPVVVLDTPEQAVPLAKALLDGGIDVMEVTYRTDAAEQAISRIAREVPEMTVGAGTVLDAATAANALAAGAKFLVSPGLSPGGGCILPCTQRSSLSWNCHRQRAASCCLCRFNRSEILSRPTVGRPGHDPGTWRRFPESAVHAYRRHWFGKSGKLPLSPNVFACGGKLGMSHQADSQRGIPGDYRPLPKCPERGGAHSE